MRVLSRLPRNDWLERPLDGRWRRWLTWCCLGAALVGVVLASFVAPRQAVVRMRYEIARLHEHVDRLERDHRRLVLEREALSSPALLAGKLEDLGLTQVGAGRLLALGADGRLQRPATSPAQPRPQGRR